ncbi:endonuclease/exonuclease/phosphatase family protein [Jatrophihabitans endophyticus]|uniref:endonuclease/exonuclease/phosphatase family protein n=1 Tax=Jatrophihabitans endophyticus TaxID=1206085 RepID=UPI0019DB4A47|nr:endonuclease/exonuclease/phosphatase family protein [Jatrophihabitans endophyticus]MBE7188606.1 endonuclease/exonuclease/phosphatase family protein [Jatrophihabitans endophyticus]
MIRSRLAAGGLSLVVASSVVGGFAPDASAAQAVVTVLQFNASEGTGTCPDPVGTDCLSPLRGANANRDMYAVEEVCRADFTRFRKQTGWHGFFREQTTRLKGATGTGCVHKGEMLVSPHRVTGQRAYSLSSGFTKGHIRHHYLLVCGLIHAAPAFYGCSTHLVFPRPDRSRTQVANLVKDTAAYRRHGRVVVAGDFNIAESSGGAGATPRLKPVVGAGYQETDKSKQPTHGTRKFDYIFYFGAGGVQQRAALTGDVATSDHKVLIGQARI